MSKGTGIDGLRRSVPKDWFEPDRALSQRGSNAHVSDRLHREI